MPVLKIRIPLKDRDFYGDGALPALVKSKLVEALDRLEQLPVPRVPSLDLSSESFSLWVSDAQLDHLEALASSHRIDGVGPVASGLLHAWASKSLVDEERPLPAPDAGALTTLDRINAALGNRTRSDQSRFFAELSAEVLQGVPNHQVIFAEASTGVGKTRAFLAGVIDWCRANPTSHAVVAAPSYNILLQIIGQWDRIAEVFEVPDSQVVVGQQEFVSRQALERTLANNPAAPGALDARAWLERNGPPAVDDPFGHPWLLRSLQVATQQQWQLMSEVTLGSDVVQDDEGMCAYRAQFEHAKRSGVVFCTHTMLAVDVRLRAMQASSRFEQNKDDHVSNAAWAAWNKLDEDDRRLSRTWELRSELLREWTEADVGRLPPIGLLVVDEAHLLEQSFAQVFASGASVSRMMRDLRNLHESHPQDVRAGDIKAMSSAWDALRDIGGQLDTDRASTEHNQALKDAVEKVRVVLAGVLKRLDKRAVVTPEVRHLKTVRLALEVASRAAGERTGMTTRVSWSPSVQWPSIEVGRYDVSRELDFLWSVVVLDRSLLVSGTLFEDVSMAGLEATRRVLSVRSSQVRPMVPVRPAWLYEPVTLHLVGDTVHADGMSRFRRPTQRDRLDRVVLEERSERWRADVAGYLALNYASAAGGTLVLLTSHAERAEIVARLEGRIPAECLLTQSEGRSLDSIARAFLELTANGKRPCLIGVGTAWTGLDLSGDALSAYTGQPLPAESDNVLTDLIIPTAPIGVNRSLTHEWRRERTGMIAEIGATSIMMRQGIGRLVRREGLPQNRRLHFLDARIHEPAWNSLLLPVIRALGPYTRRLSV